jgi:anaerobic selenocysteine-containing dehydrogenase
VCAIEAEEIRRLARELAVAPRAAVYARIGTCTQEFGTLASWLVMCSTYSPATSTARAA